MPLPRLICLLKRSLCGVGAVVLALLAGPGAAVGHMRTSTFSHLSLGGSAPTWDIKVSVVDLLAPLGLDEGLAPAQALAAVRGRLEMVQGYLGPRLRLFTGEKPCAQRADGVTIDQGSEPPMVKMRFVYSCPAGNGSYRARYDLFFDLDGLHSGFVNVSLAGTPAVSDVFRSGNRELMVVLEASRWEPLRRFWLLGVEHIFTGYDHLAFLAGLLLLATVSTRAAGDRLLQTASPRAAFWGTAKIVTAFTASHSLTLMAAALRPELVPTRFVEPLIALSVAAVGVENLLPRMPQRRWLLAFAFGLIHGFGFASVLSEIGLPAHGLVAALLSFNVGVECGQLCVVLVALPLLLMIARRWPRVYHRVLLIGGSSALVVAGVVWFVQRV